MSLSPAHKKMLIQESSITPALIEQRGYFTATKPQQLAELGFAEHQRMVPALIIPFWSVDKEIVLHQSRPDSPRENEHGKLLKYETPAGARMRLDVAPAIWKELEDPSVALWVTEGVKKADSAIARGLCCAALAGVWNFRGANAKGALTELPDWDRIPFKLKRQGPTRIVYIVYDSDVMFKPEVMAALRALAMMLRRRGAKDVRPVIIPSKDGAKIGLDDFFAAGGTVRDLVESVDKSVLDGNPILVRGRALHAITDDALEALAAANFPPQIFVRAGELCRISTDERGIAKIEGFSQASMRGVMARSRVWAIPSKGGEQIECSPPKDVVEDLMSLGQWPAFPPIVAITRAPVLAPDGTLSTAPGYDPKSHFYVASKEVWPAWGGSLRSAVDYVLNDVLGDFPFATDADRANALALMLLPIVRPVIDGPTPLHLIDAPVQGTGKSLLGKVCLMPTAGTHISATTGTRDEEEWRKKIASSLLEGRAYVFFDNLSRKVDSDSLAGVLTSTEWNDRALSTMRNINVPVRCVWVATANNAELSRDILRRTVWIRLDAGVERPEDRTGFSHPNVEQWIRENRATIVSALCTIVSAWSEAGQPHYSGPVLGSFEEWSKLIGSVLNVAGVSGFLSNIAELRRSADSDEIAWADFYRRWHLHFGSGAVKAGELMEEFTQDEDLAGMLGDKGPSSQKTRLGHLIRKRTGMVCGGFRVERHDDYGGSLRYRLSASTDQNPKNPNQTPTPDSNLNLGVFGVFGVLDQSHAHAHAPDHAGQLPPETPKTQNPKIVDEVRI